MKIRLHAVEHASRANGPGRRAVIWFQGCALRCPGCFNPATHEPSGGFEMDTAVLAEELLHNPHDIEGVSFSGGEPFQQAEAWLDVLQRLRGSRLSTLAFTGYTLEEIETMAFGPTILARLDALVAGRYLRSRHWGRGLLGSNNQQIYLLTDRYGPTAFENLPVCDIILHADGSVTLTGFSTIRLVPQNK